MLDDKIFLEKEITPSVAKTVSEIKLMIAQRIPLPKIYNHILTYSKDYRERYILLFLFGIAYQSYKEDNNLR
jgi:hypothetical protein